MNKLITSLFIFSLTINLYSKEVKNEPYLSIDDDSLDQTNGALSSYDKEKTLIESEIRDLKETSTDLTIKEKKTLYFKDIRYETARMKRMKSKSKIKELPVEMREPTDIIELKIN